MNCKFCNEPTIQPDYYNNNHVCSNHTVDIMYVSHISGKLMYTYFIHLNDKKYIMHFQYLCDKPVFRCVCIKTLTDLLNLDYHPNISPEQSINKLKSILLFQ